MTKTGWLGPYEIGPNSTYENGIYAGDARVLSSSIPDDCVDLVLTDPPFGIGYKYASGYDDDPDKYLDLIRWSIAESNRVVKPGGLCFVFVAQPRLRDVWPLFPSSSRIFAACKNWVQIRPTAVQFAYDPVIFWQKEGSGHDDDIGGQTTGRDWFVGNTSPSSFRGPNKVEFHNCPRPLDTITYMVEHFCPAGGIVLDWFMGSGTTAVAAKMTGRRWWGSEIDEGVAIAARGRVQAAPSPLFVLPQVAERGERGQVGLW